MGFRGDAGAMSSLSNKVDVLVVGAGPTGLLTALELARAGVEVEIVDRAWRAAAQSYACGLHASTMALLGQRGLDRKILDVGLRVDTMAFFEGSERKAELQFGGLGVFPFLVVLPQYQLEELLEDELRNHGVKVRWGHRLDSLTQDENAVEAIVEKLGVTSVGYPYARSEDTVEKEIAVHARYVVGADGHPSHVRQILGLPTETAAPATAFEVYEFEPQIEVGREVRVVTGPGSTDVLWPQPGCLCRWSLQLVGGAEEHQNKERSAYVVQADAGEANDHREKVERRIRARAPWFTAGIKEIDWTTVVGFESAMVRQFGGGRCWLVGDAGHQTSPIGMQSMNVGLREATDLAGALGRILRHHGSPQLLAAYEGQRIAEWRQLLGLSGGLRPGPQASAWAKAQRTRLLGCLPGSGSELAVLARQLDLEIS